VLIEALGSSSYVRRRAAARALGRIGPEAADAVPALIRAAADKDDAYLRTFAVRSLGRIAPGSPDVKRVLASAAREDGNLEVRRQAQIAQRGH
jgi:HEAT repeat protein